MSVQFVKVKSVLNKKKIPDAWFLDDYTLNAYSACSFNCLYCYIRGSKYGFNMEEKLAVKENAATLLDKELTLRVKKNQFGVIVMSSATDPYLQIENKTKLTRTLLEIILKHKFPVHVITKSDLVTRDLDLLHEINKQAILPSHLKEKTTAGVFISFSFSTIDDKVAKIFEPNATPPTIRLETLRKVANEKFITGISLMPLLPFITDTGNHLEEMYAAFKSHGAKYVMAASLTLFGDEKHDSKQLILRAIEKHYPHLLFRYQSWFDKSTGMPAYYHKAFNKKTLELCNKYGLQNRILL
ncbi:MAG: radical SAM protein [Bacteroidetes bacterium]|nr:radical SAM protein [Bacteroidota bacterium]